MANEFTAKLTITAQPGTGEVVFKYRKEVPGDRITLHEGSELLGLLMASLSVHIDYMTGIYKQDREIYIQTVVETLRHVGTVKARYE